LDVFLQAVKGVRVDAALVVGRQHIHKLFKALPTQVFGQVRHWAVLQKLGAEFY
jgi:hypothetical protein